MIHKEDQAVKKLWSMGPAIANIRKEENGNAEIVFESPLDDLSVMDYYSPGSTRAGRIIGRETGASNKPSSVYTPGDLFTYDWFCLPGFRVSAWGDEVDDLVKAIQQGPLRGTCISKNLVLVATLVYNWIMSRTSQFEKPMGPKFNRGKQHDPKLENPG